MPEDEGTAHTTPEALDRPFVGAMDEILGKAFRVLDQGFVRVVDYMGGDHSIVQAARVSYGDGTKQVHEDAGLIRYLMRNAHSTPFEMCEVKLHVRLPMDCWRQWIRHRTANVNEYSTRYSLAIDAAQRTQPEEWRLQSTGNRQGSAAFLDTQTGDQLTAGESALLQTARDVYEARVAAGVAREQARKDLPLSTYTEAYWKIDLHNLFHFLALRMHPHAQLEIRSYAEVIGQKIVANWCPVAWQAFLDYRIESVTLSRIERNVVAALLAGDEEGACSVASASGWLDRKESGELRPHRERTELDVKLAGMGLTAPWARR